MKIFSLRRVLILDVPVFFYLFITVFFFSFVLPYPTAVHASASDIYISQNGSNSTAGGTSCSDATSTAFFNSSSNWASTPTSGKIGPGTTVHICGTITGTTVSSIPGFPDENMGLEFQGSGTSGNPITLYFETGANMTSPVWGGIYGGAILTNGQSWLVIDGGSGNNGIIQNTANGSGLAYAQISHAVSITGSHTIVRNLTVENMCQHTSYNDTKGCQTSGQGSDGIGVGAQDSGNGISDVTITKNIVHDAEICIYYGASSGDSDITISDNTISRCNWGIGGGGTISPSGSLTISGNDISCVAGAPCNWNDADDNFHHNGIMIFPQDTIMNNVVIANNYFHDINPSTGYIFLNPGGTADLPGYLVYNNVFYTTPGQAGASNAMIETGGSDGKIFNNTMYGAAATSFDNSLWSGATIENNIADGQGYPENLALNDPSGHVTGITDEYNDYYGYANSWSVGSGSFLSWQQNSTPWCSGGCDTVGSVIGDPVLVSNLVPGSPNFSLGSGSAAIQAGTNLTSFGIQGLDVTASQYFGVNYACGNGCVPRPSTGPWDIGANPSLGAPSAKGQTLYTTAGVPINITLTGYDPKGNSFTYNVTQPANGGTWTGTVPNLVYTPPSSGTSDSFTYTVTDSVTGLVSNIATISISITPLPDVTTGMVGYWNFNDGSGATAADCSSLSSGTSILSDNSNCNGPNPGTLNNFSTWGSVAGALQFNANQNQSVSAGTTGIPPNASPITVSAWVYTTSSSETGQIISRVNNSYKFVEWSLQFQGSDDLVFYDQQANSSWYEVDPGVSLTPNAWHHVAVTFDGSSYSVMKIYIDGVLKSSSESPASGFNSNSSLSSITIGSGTSAAISYVRVYNRELAGQDVNELYSMGRDSSVSVSTPTSPTTYTLTVSSPSGGTITSSDNAISCGSTCSQTGITSGTNITLTATPSSGYDFTSWGGSCSGTSTTCNLSVTSNESVSAVFTAQTTTPPPSGTTGGGGGGGGGSSYASSVAISNLSTTIAPTSATISWKTNAPVFDQAVYGLTTAYGSQTGQSATASTTHKAVISNLLPNTAYHYYLVSFSSGTVIQSISSDYSFVTPKAGAQAVMASYTTTVAAAVPGCPKGMACSPVATIVGGGAGTGCAPAANQLLATNYQFTRNLTLGSTGSDVKALQQFLNSKGFTVAASGNGSPGHESTYYGPATASAVSRFQVAHTSAILVPYGLTNGTGNFGSATIKEVESLEKKQ
jgi:hypothetical protein